MSSKYYFYLLIYNINIKDNTTSIPDQIALTDPTLQSNKDINDKMLERAKRNNFDLWASSDDKKRSFLRGSWEGFLYIGIVYGTPANFMYYVKFSGEQLTVYKKGPGTIDDLDKMPKELIYSGSYSLGSNENGSTWFNSRIKSGDSQIVPIKFDCSNLQLYLEKSLSKDNPEALTLTEVKLVIQYGDAYVNMDKTN